MKSNKYLRVTVDKNRKWNSLQMQVIQEQDNTKKILYNMLH